MPDIERRAYILYRDGLTFSQVGKRLSVTRLKAWDLVEAYRRRLLFENPLKATRRRKTS